MKTFPPLHPETAKALPPRLEYDMPILFHLERSLYNAEIHIGLGMLIFETMSQITRAAEETDSVLPSIEEGRKNSLFGKIATVAMLYGDESFFEQVIYCSKAIRSGNGFDDLKWLGSYVRARLDGSLDGSALPTASVVAAIKNHDKKTAIPAVDARDACRKLKLPLAEGSRGKKRKVEKPQ
jgi:hypothetical protein